MKVTIEVTKQERDELLRNWQRNMIGDYQGFAGYLAIKLARAIKKMEREK